MPVIEAHQLLFLGDNDVYSLACLSTSALVDVDETLCTQCEFERKYGWSPQGEEAHQYQLRIGTRAFSTIAAYTTVGFIALAIYEGSVTHVEVEHFLVEYLQPVLSDESMCILHSGHAGGGMSRQISLLSAVFTGAQAH